MVFYRKSKTCPEQRRRIQNLKWLGLSVIVFVFVVAGAVAQAQQPAKIPRIGFLGNSTPALEENLVGPFREGLRDLGYVEGKNILIEYRWAEGKYDRFPALIGDLVAQKVDIIVTAGTPASLAVKKAAPSISLVMLAVGDPIGTGLIESLAHPGGNVTGLSAIAADLEGKRLELLREVIPGLSHVAVFWNPASPFQVVSEKEVQTAARAFRMKVLSLGFKLRSNSTTPLRPFAKNGRVHYSSWRIVSSCTTGRALWNSQPKTACRGYMRTWSW